VNGARDSFRSQSTAQLRIVRINAVCQMLLDKPGGAWNLETQQMLWVFTCELSVCALEPEDGVQGWELALWVGATTGL
jgi:hypothetical protein